MEIVPYLVLFAVVLGVNLLPAFGPPTWTIIVLYGLNSNMPAWLIVPIAALAAASGRFLLANAFRVLANHVSQQTKKNLKAAREAFARNRKGGIAALGLFALSPVPSAQLFEATGLAGVRMLPFTAAFFVGRLVSYSIYAASAKGIQQSSLGDAFREGLTSPIGIGLQVAMIAGLVALARVDWEKLLKRGKA
jgi:uncharacterized membrane protein YdjX (TVP38/TMEM64 family)